jgi:hypothetical protein
LQNYLLEPLELFDSLILSLNGFNHLIKLLEACVGDSGTNLQALERYLNLVASVINIAMVITFLVAKHLLKHKICTLLIGVVNKRQVLVVPTLFELLDNFFLSRHHLGSEVEHVLNHNVLLQDITNLKVLFQKQSLPPFLSDEESLAISCSLIEEL